MKQLRIPDLRIFRPLPSTPSRLLRINNLHNKQVQSY